MKYSDYMIIFFVMIIFGWLSALYLIWVESKEREKLRDEIKRLEDDLERFKKMTGIL
jgi:hypothetical protein